MQKDEKLLNEVEKRAAEAIERSSAVVLTPNEALALLAMARGEAHAD